MRRYPSPPSRIQTLGPSLYLKPIHGNSSMFCSGVSEESDRSDRSRRRDVSKVQTQNINSPRPVEAQTFRLLILQTFKTENPVVR